MLSAEEQRILREIEHGLRQDDPSFGHYLAAAPIRDPRRRRGVRVCLALELVFVALVVVGAVAALPALIIVGAGLGVLVPMVALTCWLPPPDPPELFGYW